MKFRDYLVEAKATSGPAEHPEDMALSGGAEGFRQAHGALKDVYGKMKGEFNTTRVSEDLEGSQTIVFGHNPENGQFFVASSATDPKLNYTPEDIEKNYRGDDDTIKALTTALENLPDVTPERYVYQGDILYLPDDLTEHDDQYHFTPKDKMYSVNTDSDHGKKMKSAAIGIVVHSRLSGPSLSNMKSASDPGLSDFEDAKNVHIIDSEMEDGLLDSKSDFRFQHHHKQAEKEFESGGDATAVVQGHGKQVKSYLQKTSKEGTPASVQGYRKHLMDDGDEAVANAPPRGKQDEHEQSSRNMLYLADNEEAFESFFDVHSHMQKAKDALVDSLNGSKKFETSKDGEEAESSGFTAMKDGRRFKLQKRAQKPK